MEKRSKGGGRVDRRLRVQDGGRNEGGRERVRKG